MKRYWAGFGVSLVVNVATIVAWFYIGPLVPAAINALGALILLGVYGLDDKWAFPLGYWTVELVAVITWVTGISGLMNLVNSISGSGRNGSDTSGGQ